MYRTSCTSEMLRCITLLTDDRTTEHKAGRKLLPPVPTSVAQLRQQLQLFLLLESPVLPALLNRPWSQAAAALLFTS